MKILEVSDFHNTGGASIAASRIASALRQEGHTCIRLSSDALEPQKSLFLGKKVNLFVQFLSIMGIDCLTSKIVDKETIRQFKMHLSKYQPDHILFHNIHGTDWPIRMINTALNYAPTTWTLHDCWSFLGCFYPSYSPEASDGTLQKLDSFWSRVTKSRYQLSAVTPSSWMCSEATRHCWSEMNVETIHNPVPNYFSEKIDKASAKRSFGLNANKKVVLCIAGNLTESRKGGSILKDILSSELTDSYQFLLIGNSFGYSIENSKKVFEHGFLNDEISLRLAYNAADLTLHTAPIDNLPNTIAESMTCGTPVMAFEVGGVPEMIIDNDCGWLEKDITPKAIITRLNSLSKNQKLETYGVNAYERAKSLFHEQKIAKKYISHFDFFGNSSNCCNRNALARNELYSMGRVRS